MEENKIDSPYKCAVCLNLLLNPITLPCGHSVCQECLERWMEFKSECPLCKGAFHFPNGPKVDRILARAISEKFHEEIKAREAEVRSTPAPDELVTTSSCPAVEIKGLHLIPGEMQMLSMSRDSAPMLEHVATTNKRLMILPRCKKYGSWVEMLNVSNTGKLRVLVRCMARAQCGKKTRDSRGWNLVQFETIIDEIPVGEEDQKKVLERLKQVYESQYLLRIKELPKGFMSNIKNRLQEPKLPSESSMKEKLVYAMRVSLHMAANVGAKTKQPEILYTQNTLERLNWCSREMESSRDTVSLFGGESSSQMCYKAAAFLIFCIAVLVGIRYFNSGLRAKH